MITTHRLSEEAFKALVGGGGDAAVIQDLLRIDRGEVPDRNELGALLASCARAGGRPAVGCCPRLSTDVFVQR